MDKTVIAHKVKPTLIVEAVKFNKYNNNNNNVIYVKSNIQINEETASKEKE